MTRWGRRFLWSNTQPPTGLLSGGGFLYIYVLIMLKASYQQITAIAQDINRRII